RVHHAVYVELQHQLPTGDSAMAVHVVDDGVLSLLVVGERWQVDDGVCAPEVVVEVTNRDCLARDALIGRGQRPALSARVGWRSAQRSAGASAGGPAGRA